MPAVRYSVYSEFRPKPRPAGNGPPELADSKKAGPMQGPPETRRLPVYNLALMALEASS